jgi:hypothetical protein
MTVACPTLDGVDLTAMTDDDLEQGICGFAARLAAATCVWVQAIAEFDRRRAWADWGCKSMAHWLTWKCAMGPAAAREHVRVGAALVQLPVVAGAFRDGRLSYSQVRAISRVATTATESDFLELATTMTASQLEIVVRGYRSVRAQVTNPDHAPRTRRSLAWHTDDDGSLVGTFRLPVETGAVLQKAVETAMDLLRADHADATDSPDDPVDDPARATAADALAEVADRYLSALANDDAGARGDDRYLITIVAEQRVLDAPAGQPVDGVCHVEDGGPLPASTVSRLACGHPTVTIIEDQDGRILDVGRRTRRPNRAMRRALTRRDGHCQFPGCTTRRTQAHHIDHWITGGQTRLTNLVSLCSHHHHRHHDGTFTVTARTDGTFAFARRDGRPISPVAPRPDSDLPSDPGVEPAVPTCTPDWDGSNLNDLSWLVGTMIRNHGLVDDSLPADHEPIPDQPPIPAGIAEHSGGRSWDTPSRTSPPPAADTNERDRWPDPWPNDWQPHTRWPGE